MAPAQESREEEPRRPAFPLPPEGLLERLAADADRHPPVLAWLRGLAPRRRERLASALAEVLGGRRQTFALRPALGALGRRAEPPAPEPQWQAWLVDLGHRERGDALVLATLAALDPARLLAALPALLEALEGDCPQRPPLALHQQLRQLACRYGATVAHLRGQAGPPARAERH